MSFRPGIVYILFFLLVVCLPSTIAQKVSRHFNAPNSDSVKAAREHIQDSVKEVRQHKLDSSHVAQKHYLDSVKTSRLHSLDSMKASRLHFMDSTKNVRKHFTDSMASVRKYKNSRHYRDSVTKARNAKVKLIAKQRKASVDSIQNARKKAVQEVTAARKKVIDSVHKIQKRRSDSVAVIRKYKQSKRYADSVKIVRHVRMDSMHAMRKRFNDSLFKVRKKYKDSVTIERKHVMDSTKLVRKKYTDSIKAVRKARADKLAKIKADKEKLLKEKEKAREKKMIMALDLKIKQKREKWSNETMLKKKWIPPRRNFQDMTTRYNYYFNANRKMDEALANMQRGKREDFDSVIGIYPYDPNKDSSRLAADMDSIIHKVSIGIQIHDPRTKWADDMYLLLGEAYYYKGGYENAATSFRYIISMDEQRKKDEAMHSSKTNGPSIVENEKKSRFDFLKHQPVHNEAILWLARTFTESHQLENAESILSLLDSDPNLPENLQGRLALEKAFVYLNDHNYPDASKQLAIVVKDNNIADWIRVRCAFINGQLLQRDHNYIASTENFKKVIDFNPKIDMEFYARKYMAYNTMYAGGDVAGMIASLEKVLNDTKYMPYYDQVYYILGQLAANGNNTEDAIVYLHKSISTPKATKKQKSISFAGLGNIYFNEGNYLEAKKAYDSSSKLASNAPHDSLVLLAVKRSKVLGGVSGPLTIIHDEDSLLALAGLSEKEQNSVVRKYLRYLERRRDDSIYKAESMVAPLAQNDNPDAANWYFGNPSLMQQGNADFKRKWGNRPLADNWRRSAAIAQNASGSNEKDSTAEAGPELDENGLPTEESLLAAIPNDDEAKEKAGKKIQKAFIDLADAYIRELEDFPLATRTLDTLDKRYPGHTYKEEDTYLRYLIALRQGKVEEALAYSSQILQKYPDSKYASLVRPTEDKPSQMDTGVSVVNFYDETYSLLIQYQYTDVLARVHEAQKKYKDPGFKKRFHIMEAIALAGSGNFKQADTLLAEFIKSNPSDSLKIWADNIIKFLGKNPPMPLAGVNNGPLLSHWPYYGEPLAKPTSVEEMERADSIANAALSKRRADTVFESTATAEDKAIRAAKILPALISYSRNPAAEHYVGIALPAMENRMVKLRAAIKSVDSQYQSQLQTQMQYQAQYQSQDQSQALLQDHSIYIDLFNSEHSILLVKSFPNLDEAKNYLNNLDQYSNIFSEYKPNEYQMFIISAHDYKKLLFDHNISEYLDFYHQNFK